MAETIDPRVSRITIVTKANEPLVEQIEKQLRKLINVIKLRDLTGSGSVQREMALICVKARQENQGIIKKIMSDYNARMLDEGGLYFIFEVTGNEDTIDELLALLEPFGIKKLARSGVLALYRET